VSEETVRRLEHRAAAHGRSVEAEHRAIVEEAVAAPTTANWAERIAATGIGEFDPDELRDRTDTGRSIELSLDELRNISEAFKGPPMSYLLDTTVLVDLGRRYPPTRRWFTAQKRQEFHTASVTVGELFRGVYQRHGRDAAALADVLREIRDGLLGLLTTDVLPSDAEAAEIWGRIMGEGAARGRTPPSDDAKIAAIAIRHGLTVATSNTRDFARLVATVDPRTA
jgi:predicted nucleic acid-binding protein/plasmid stability protein